MAFAIAGSRPALHLTPLTFPTAEVNGSKRVGCLPTQLLETQCLVGCVFNNGSSIGPRLCRPIEFQNAGHVTTQWKQMMSPNAISSDGSSHHHTDMLTCDWFNVEDPRAREPPWRGRVFEANQTWQVLRQDLEFCDWKARQDVYAIKALHDKMVDILNPMAKDWKSVKTMHRHRQLSNAHEQVHLAEARVAETLQKLGEMERLVNDKLLEDPTQAVDGSGGDLSSTVSAKAEISVKPPISHKRTHGLIVAGPLQEYSPALKNFWYPVAFMVDIKEDTMVPFECFEEPWVLFRGKDGSVGCVRNSCAHRACPLHLGEVKDGRIQCPYHGWEYAPNGMCEKMPSTKPVKVRIQALPCVERDGLVWIWPGDGAPDENFPSLEAPAGYTTHAELVIELPVEHGLLIENLLDLAHAPFTHTSTFAKGWPVPSLVKFCTPATAFQGYWDPYPIDMEFQPPCMVRSTIGISKPGKLEGSCTRDCTKHLHQLHVCLPSSRGKTRLLYRLSLDFFSILKHVPHIQFLWTFLANKVLDEDLRLVLGQQDRMIRGANVWNLPVAYDKLGLRYRKWRLALEEKEGQMRAG